MVGPDPEMDSFHNDDVLPDQVQRIPFLTVIVGAIPQNIGMTSAGVHVHHHVVFPRTSGQYMDSYMSGLYGESQFGVASLAVSQLYVKL